MIEVYLLLALTMVLVVLAVLYRDNELDNDPQIEDSCQLLEDSKGRAISLRLSAFAANRWVSEGRLPQLGSLYSFATGLLAGLCAFLLWLQIENPTRPNSVWSPFVWLLAVGFIRLGVFTVERRMIKRLISRGMFDRAIASGVDPLDFATEACLRAKVLEYWSFPIALAGVAAASPAGSPVGGVVPAVIILAIQAIRAILDARNSTPKIIAARDLGKAIARTKVHVADGGWVGPVGALLSIASLGLVHLDHPETIVLAGCIFVFVGLVTWSERVSRAKTGLRTADELRAIVRGQVMAQAPAEARVETIFQQDN